MEINERIKLVIGDITKMDVDAIVNSANPRLLKGGGVCGAIYQAAGPQILAETQALGGCETGDARITRGYQLRARYVIHTVGPVYDGGNSDEALLLENCYKRCFEVAAQHKVRSIAFPSISTGVYGYPIKEASLIALRSTLEQLKRFPQVNPVYFVLFSDGDFKWYSQHLNDLLDNRDPWDRIATKLNRLEPNFSFFELDEVLRLELQKSLELLSGPRSAETLNEFDSWVSALTAANEQIIEDKCFKTVHSLQEKVTILTKLLDERRANPDVRNEVLHPFVWGWKRDIQNETIISNFDRLLEEVEEEFENALAVIEDLNFPAR